MQAPQQEAITVIVTHADGSAIFNDEISPNTANSLKQALEDLSGFESSENSEEESQEDNFAQDRQFLKNGQTLLNWMNKNDEEREQVNKKSSLIVGGILTIMKRENYKLQKQQEILHTQQQDTSSALLLLSQEKNQQLQSQINDMKHEQSAIKQEFEVQYKKSYSNLCAAVVQLNKQQADVKNKLTEEIGQLKFYVRFFATTTSTLACVLFTFLTWFYMNNK